MGLSKLHQANAPVIELIKEFGRKAVADELNWMISTERAYWALQSAIRMEDRHLSDRAATMILASGTYSEDAVFMAREYIKAQEDKLRG